MTEPKSGTLTILRDLTSQMGKTLLMAVPPVRKWRLRRPRTSPHLNDLDTYLRDNAFFGLNQVIEYGDGVKGRSVCEIGPGDFLTSGLSFLAAGASHYTAIDRFPGDYSGATAKDLYKKVAANWHRHFPDIVWDENLDPESFPERYEDRLGLIGDPIEKAVVAEKFDVLCSFQVGEHVSDIHTFARAHNNLLKEDGVGIHRIDFGPHDVWSEYRDPSTFLRFPELLWKLTGANRGIPNRRRHLEFVEAFKRAGLNVEVLLTEYFDEEFVDYGKLDRRFRSMQKDSVLVKTGVYRLRRKGRSDTL